MSRDTVVPTHTPTKQLRITMTSIQRVHLVCSNTSYILETSWIVSSGESFSLYPSNKFQTPSPGNLLERIIDLANDQNSGITQINVKQRSIQLLFNGSVPKKELLAKVAEILDNRDRAYEWSLSFSL